MKNTTNVISLRKKKFNKKYGKVYKYKKYFLIIMVVPVILTCMFMFDRMVTNLILSKSGIDYNQYYETKIENAIDEEFRENYKKDLY